MPVTPRHLVCTAARPTEATAFDPRWRTETSVALARGIVLDVAFDRFPILADALEDAGCDDVLLLRHCRECGEHTTRCWVLGAVFDRPPVVEPPRMTDAEVRREVERLTGRPVLRPSADPWNGRVPARIWLFRSIPVVVFAVVMSWFAWSSISSPLTGVQYAVPTAPSPPATSR